MVHVVVVVLQKEVVVVVVNVVGVGIALGLVALVAAQAVSSTVANPKFGSLKNL